MEQKIKSLNCIDNDLGNIQKVVLDELSQASPYFNLLHQQLAGALKDTEDHIVTIMKCLDEIGLVTISQKDRIKGSLHKVIVQTSSVDGQSCQHKAPIQSPTAENNKILEVMRELDNGNKDIFNQLSEALGHLQFQDVLRQRVEQVQSAILELDEHFIGLANQIGDTSLDSRLSPTLKEHMESHLNQYVMESQRDIYTSIIGNVTTKNDTVS